MTTVIGMLFVVAVGNIKPLGGYTGVPNIPPPDTIHSALSVHRFDEKVDFSIWPCFFLSHRDRHQCVLFFVGRTGMERDRPESRLAQSMGINVFRLPAFVVCGRVCDRRTRRRFLCALSDLYHPHCVQPVSQDDLHPGVRGAGGVGYATLGPIVGAALLTFFPEFVSVAERRAYSSWERWWYW